MGKDLNGKELGTGLSQRKDGRYSARWTNNAGKRIEKYFATAVEAKKYLRDAQYDDAHSILRNGGETTVEAWAEYWLEEIKKPLVRHNTYSLYKRYYKNFIKPVIGDMLLKDVLPIHCQKIANACPHSAVALGNMLKQAELNGLIVSNPCVAGKIKVPEAKKRRADDAKFMTEKEEKKLLELAKAERERCNYYNEYAFVLQTGLRVSELLGLKWSAVDFENKTITINNQLYFDQIKKCYTDAVPKTSSGVRTIPLTPWAVEILRNEKAKNRAVDGRWKDYVFLQENGKPLTITMLDGKMKRLCIKGGIPEFSMHSLRHTFASRCIAAGMSPKVLQKILGHSTIKMTMDLYVHISDDTKKDEFDKFLKYTIEKNNKKI